MEVGRMPYLWPEETDFTPWELDVLDRDCPCCERMMHVCDHRHRRFHTLDGPVELLCRLNHCPDPTCPGHSRTKSPELEITIALPKWAIGWDVLCWIGHRRCSRHWPISQIQAELKEEYGIKLSAETLARYIGHYQVMLAARQEDPEALRRQYESVAEIILSIDGLQPEKGHETLYVVRELTQKRVWFAEALISATADEVRRLIVLKRQGVEAALEAAGDDVEAARAAVVEPADAAEPSAAEADPAGGVVLDYCVAVRGIVNDDQGGPLHPPGLRMAEALQEVRESLQRNLDAKKGGSQRSNSTVWPGVLTEDWSTSKRSRSQSESTSRTSTRWPRPSNPEGGVARIARRSSRS